MPRHNFNDHAKFAIIEEIKAKSLSTSKIRNMSRQRKSLDFKITNYFPEDLDISLNYPQDTTVSI